MTSIGTSIAYPSPRRANIVDALGMRPMQTRVYAQRHERYLLIKSPPASGKSRALMYVALDKLLHQGLERVIIAVPEKSIGASFRSNPLSNTGFEADWVLLPENDLCGGAANDKSNAEAFKRFLSAPIDPNNHAGRVLLCTHATLRNAWSALSNDEKIGWLDNPYHRNDEYARALERSLIAIDEFHHGSADEGSQLGRLVRDIVANRETHLVAMTGSYFRGDSVPVMRPEDEARMAHVTYSYYEQLSSYEHLKNLDIDYRFYDGHWIDRIEEVIDTTRKTIIHIPSVNSAAAGGTDKHAAVNGLIDRIGVNRPEIQEADSPYIVVETMDGRRLRIADLVTPASQEATLAALRSIKDKNDVDIVIALGMAKEGFDWVWCEHAITIGARGSLTEIVQIIGRTTRDAPGKRCAYFTNVIAEPDQALSTVKSAINDYLKAIAGALLMEQVMAPQLNFRVAPTNSAIIKNDGDGVDLTTIDSPIGEIRVRNLEKPQTSIGLTAIQQIDDIHVAALANPHVQAELLQPGLFPDGYIASTIIPNIIRQKYPAIADNDDEIGRVRDHVLLDQHVREEVLRQSAQANTPSPTTAGEPRDNEDAGAAAGRVLIDLASAINVGDLDIELVRKIEPWRTSYALLSKSFDQSMLEEVRNAIRGRNIEMTDEEALQHVPGIRAFRDANGRPPSIDAESPRERRMAEAMILIQRRTAERQREREAEANPANSAEADLAKRIVP